MSIKHGEPPEKQNFNLRLVPKSYISNQEKIRLQVNESDIDARFSRLDMNGR